MPVKIGRNNYTTVAERLKALHTNNEYTSVLTNVVDFSDTLVRVDATVKITKFIDSIGANPLPDGKYIKVVNKYNGTAYEVIDSTNKRSVNYANALENCETSAIGRALASAGYGGDYFASANEMKRITPQVEAKTNNIKQEQEQGQQQEKEQQEQLKLLKKVMADKSFSVEEVKAFAVSAFGTGEIRSLDVQQIKRLISIIGG